MKEYFHYKERTPIETVNLIKQFFENKNYNIKLTEDMSEIESFYCHLDLYKNNTYIFSSAGKGVSRDYALASGYAELYERFCNKVFLLNSLIVNKKIEELNLSNFQKINYKDLLKKYQFIKDYGKDLFNTDDNKIIERYLFFITNNLFYPDVFQHLELEKEKIILDNRIMFKITGSTGMAAGNTFEEAFNQGMSEIYERWCHREFLFNQPNIFYQLSDNFLSTLNIYPYIQKLKELNYKVYIFDLGYNYQAPVILTIIINPNKMNAYYNLGSFPIINIAIERTLTEIYQGIKSYNDIEIIEQQIPFRSLNSINILSKNSASTLKCFCIDEFLFNKIQVVENCSNVFFNTNKITNYDIFNFFKLLNKKHNFNIYYQNNSLSKDIYALYLFCPEVLQNKYNKQKKYFFNNDLIFKILLNYKDLINNILKIDIQNSLINILNIKNYFNYNDRIKLLLYGDGLSFFSNGVNNKIFFDLFELILNYNNLNILQNKIFNIKSLSLYQINLIKFIFIQNYLKANYSYDEIINISKIFNNNLNITIEDIKDSNDCIYLIKNIFIIPFYNYYNNNEYKNIILEFYNNKEGLKNE